MKTLIAVIYTPGLYMSSEKVYFVDPLDATNYLNDVAIKEFAAKDARLAYEEFSDDVEFVWVLSADNHDYDAMSQWFIGVFKDYNNAVIAKAADLRKYLEENRYSSAEQVNYYLAQHRVE